MGPKSSEDSYSFTTAAAVYRAAAARDPRRFRFGYLAAEPESGARAAFVWFASPDEMLEFLRVTEVALLQFDEHESARIAASLQRACAGIRDVARLDREALSAAFEGWCEILWIGAFTDLCERGGTMPTSLRAEFRAAHGLDAHAGPITDGEAEAFVAYLASWGSEDSDP